MNREAFLTKSFPPPRNSPLRWLWSRTNWLRRRPVCNVHKIAYTHKRRKLITFVPGNDGGERDSLTVFVAVAVVPVLNFVHRLTEANVAEEVADGTDGVWRK